MVARQHVDLAPRLRPGRSNPRSDPWLGGTAAARSRANASRVSPGRDSNTGPCTLTLACPVALGAQAALREQQRDGFLERSSDIDKETWRLEPPRRLGALVLCGEIRTPPVRRLVRSMLRKAKTPAPGSSAQVTTRQFRERVAILTPLAIDAVDAPLTSEASGQTRTPQAMDQRKPNRK